MLAASSPSATRRGSASASAAYSGRRRAISLYTRLVRSCAPTPSGWYRRGGGHALAGDAHRARDRPVRAITRLATPSSPSASPRSVVPGLTTTEDLGGATGSWPPTWGSRSPSSPFSTSSAGPRTASATAGRPRHPPRSAIHSDVGVRYLDLTSDHQEWAYVLCPGRRTPRKPAPAPRRGQPPAGRYMASFEQGSRGTNSWRASWPARRVGIPKPRVYSHSLGHLLHEPGR